MRTVHQLVATLSPHDAVSNEALALQDALRELGFRSELFAENIALPLRGRARPLSDLHPRPDDAVLLHYSIWSAVIPRAVAAGGPLVLRYHSVTPEHWFMGINGAGAGRSPAPGRENGARDRRLRVQQDRARGGRLHEDVCGSDCPRG
jgi:hypothetical protein